MKHRTLQNSFDIIVVLVLKQSGVMCNFWGSIASLEKPEIVAAGKACSI